MYTYTALNSTTRQSLLFLLYKYIYVFETYSPRASIFLTFKICEFSFINYLKCRIIFQFWIAVSWYDLESYTGRKGQKINGENFSCSYNYDSHSTVVCLPCIYSDDSFIQKRLFPVDISGLTSFKDYWIAH